MKRFPKTLLRLIHIRHKDSRISPLAGSALGNLPLELFTEITNSLPPESVACFALTCRVIYHIIGKGCFALLKQEPSVCYRFLRQLEADMPDVVTCPSCVRFHAIRNAVRYVDFRSALFNKHDMARRKTDLDNPSTSGLPFYFSFLIVQMAIKHARQGFDTRSLLALLKRAPRRRFTAPYAWRTQSHVTILGDRLLFKNQHTVKRLAQTDLVFPEANRVSICLHCTISKEDLSKFLISKDLGGLTGHSWSIPGNLLSWGDLVQCKYCMTEFHVQCEWRDHVATDLSVSVWRDLGDGYCDTTGSRFEPSWFPPGSIRAEFERPKPASP